MNWRWSWFVKHFNLPTCHIHELADCYLGSTSSYLRQLLPQLIWSDLIWSDVTWRDMARTNLNRSSRIFLVAFYTPATQRWILILASSADTCHHHKHESQRSGVISSLCVLSIIYYPYFHGDDCFDFVDSIDWNDHLTRMMAVIPISELVNLTSPPSI